MSKTIYTIGYTGFSIESFIHVLKKYSINVVIDVRSSPYSERYPQYNKPSIEKILIDNRIYYRNYKKEFGARQEDKKFTSEEGYLDFELFSQSAQFKEGISKIVNSVNQGYNIVFLCAEKKPVMCHRTILVARAFYEIGYDVIHIMPNNQIMTQKQIEDELLTMFFPERNQLNLFSSSIESEDKYISYAYKLQNKAIGYHPEDNL